MTDLTGKHGYSGACVPGNGHAFAGMKTCSVGVFEYRRKASGDGLKRGPVKVRVSGPVSQVAAIHKKAGEILDKLDRREYDGPRNVTVKS